MLRIDAKGGYASPDSTYFRTDDIAPRLETTESGEPTIELFNGTGSRRSSWGNPGVTSTVVLESEDIVAVHVGFYHKHGGGQFWRYYVPTTEEEGQEWTQVQWRVLPDTMRQWVLDALETRAPGWANTPGKLKVDYQHISGKTYTSYKLVRVRSDGVMVSVYDRKTEYVLGKRLTERVQEEHGGGYYSFYSQDEVLERFHAGTLFASSYYQPMTLALLECEIGGRIISYPHGKIASTHLKPVRMVLTFDYTPLQRESEAS